MAYYASPYYYMLLNYFGFSAVVVRSTITIWHLGWCSPLWLSCCCSKFTYLCIYLSTKPYRYAILSMDMPGGIQLWHCGIPRFWNNEWVSISKLTCLVSFGVCLRIAIFRIEPAMVRLCLPESLHVARSCWNTAGKTNNHNNNNNNNDLSRLN